MSTPSLFHKKVNTLQEVQIFKDKLPQSTDIWCWWCCHSFDSIPVAMPYEYNITRDSFVLVGTFCSLSCCKSYILESPHYNKPIIIANLKMLSKRMGLNYKDRITPAPPRQLLKVFGGYLDIDEYRTKIDLKIALTLLQSNHTIQKNLVQEKSNMNTNTIQRANTISFETKERETFSLKRDKPLKKKRGTLESAMGLTVN